MAAPRTQKYPLRWDEDESSNAQHGERPYFFNNKGKETGHFILHQFAHF
jgi:hypothetical protein